MHRLDQSLVLEIVAFVPNAKQLFALLNACHRSMLSSSLMCLLELGKTYPEDDLWPILCLRTDPIWDAKLYQVLQLYNNIYIYDLNWTETIKKHGHCNAMLHLLDMEAPSNYQVIAVQIFTSSLHTVHLNLKSFSPSKILSTAEALKHCTKLERLHLSWTPSINPTPLLLGLKECPKLTCLSVGYSQLLYQTMYLTAEDGGLIASSISQLKHFEISSTKVESKLLVAALQQSRRLESLSVVNGIDFCSLFFDGTCIPMALKKLVLHCTGLKSVDMAQLGFAIQSSALQTLQLSNNYLGACGMQTIMPRVASISTLRTLVLSSTFIMDEGCQWVAAGLRKMKSLTSLDLSMNFIGCPGALAIAPALPPSLRILQLKLNRLGDKGLAAIVKHTSLHLEVLDVSNTLISAFGVQRLLDHFTYVPESKLQVDLSRIEANAEEIHELVQSASALNMTSRLILASKTCY